MADSQKDMNSLLQKAAGFRRDASNALEAGVKSLMKEKGLSEELARIEARKSAVYKENLASLKEINSQVAEIRTSTKENIGSLMAQEQSLKSLTGLQASLVEQDRKRIDILSEGKIENASHKDSLESIASLNQELLGLSAEDNVSKFEISRQIEEQFEKLGDVEGITAEIAALEAEKFAKAKGVASMTQKQQKFLTKQLEVYEGIRDTIGGVLETASLLTSTVGGVLGGALIGAGAAGKKLLNTAHELGGSLLSSSNISTTLFGTVFKDAVGTTKNLSKEFGGLNDVSLKTQLNTNVMAENMGISTAEAAGLYGQFARLNGGSTAVAENLIQSSKELAIQNGLVPADVMADLAGSTEEFATFGKEGGTNIAEAAIAAGKLGVTMKTLSGVTDNLLDFESSINAELELGAMLGKNINLDRARALAYEGDIGGMVRETLSSLGGIEAFNKMDVFSKRKTAQLLGVSVAEFEKMAANADKLNKDGSIQLSTYDQTLQTLKAFGSPILTGVQSLGGMAVAAGQMGFNLKDGLASMKGMTGIGGKLKGFFSGVFGKGADMVKDKAGDMLKSKSGKLFSKDSPQGKMIANMKKKAPDVTKLTPDATSVSDKVNKTTGGKGMKIGNVLKGAAAILILSAALFVAAKAFQEFGSVTWEAVAMGLVGLAGMAAIASVLGKMQGEMIKGAAAVALLGVALIPFAFAMSMIAGLDIGSVVAAAAGLVIFSAAVFGLGALMMTGVGAFIFGAGLLALVGLGAAMMVLGTGLLVAGAGFQAIGGSMGTILAMVSQVGSVIGGITEYITPIAALALALVGLAGALTMVGLAGLMALPGLMAISAVGAVAVGVGSMLGFGDETPSSEKSESNPLLAEIKGLRDDLTSGKVGVYIDGNKLTAAIAKVVDKVGSNSYAI